MTFVSQLRLARNRKSIVNALASIVHLFAAVHKSFQTHGQTNRLDYLLLKPGEAVNFLVSFLTSYKERESI